MIDQEQRRQHFNHACELLGGQRAVARILDVSDRTVRNLCSGTSEIKQGFMHDLTAALREHGGRCRLLADQTDPLFTANLTAAEATARRRAQEKARG